MLARRASLVWDRDGLDEKEPERCISTWTEPVASMEGEVVMEGKASSKSCSVDDSGRWRWKVWVWRWRLWRWRSLAMCGDDEAESRKERCGKKHNGGVVKRMDPGGLENSCW